MADNKPDRVNLSIERAVQHANALSHEYVIRTLTLFYYGRRSIRPIDKDESRCTYNSIRIRKIFKRT